VVPKIRTVAVIGAGLQGIEIAYAVALAGYRTILEDILPASLRKAEAGMRTRLDAALRLGQIARDAAEAMLQRIEYASTVEEAARQADLVIEAVPDELESKLEIFILLDKICKPETILASSTSVLGISEIASVTYRAERCIGLRFSHSGQVEVVRGPADDETFGACSELALRMH
jgi:3-hydroxybutyryl-CoA dehydrogenase